MFKKAYKKEESDFVTKSDLCKCVSSIEEAIDQINTETDPSLREDLNTEIMERENADEEIHLILNQKTDQDDFLNHINDHDNPHQITKSAIGLGNVDNTADINKPVSNAVQSALNLKEDKSALGTAAYRNIGLGPTMVPDADDTVRKDASNLEEEAIEIVHLAQEVRDLFAGGSTFPIADRLGVVTSLLFDFPDPATNEDKWYDSAVTGSGSGNNAPSDDLEAGGIIYSNGTDWISIPAKPTNIPHGTLGMDEMAPSIREMLNVGKSINDLQLIVLNLLETWFLPIAGRLNNNNEWDIFAFLERNTGYFKAKYNELDQGLWSVVSRAMKELANMYLYTANDGIIPIVTDYSYRVLLGFDLNSNSIIGLMPEGGGSTGGDDFGDISPENRIAQSDLNVILFAGESTSIGAAGNPVLSGTPNPSLANLTWDVGPKASKTGGTVGSNDGMLYMTSLFENNLAADGGSNRGETGCFAAANYASKLLLLEEGIQPQSHPFLASSCGRGGAKITGINSGSSWFQLARDHIDRAFEVSDEDYGDTAYLQVVCFSQGANEEVGDTNRAQYLSRVKQYRSDLESYASSRYGMNVSVHMILPQTSFNSRLWSDIVLAQLDAALEDEKIHLTGPTYHLPYAVDGVHLTNEGYIWQGCYFGQAIKDIHMGKNPKWIKPVGASVSNDVVTVSFKCPTTLVFDESLTNPTQDYGFKVTTLADLNIPILNLSASGNKVFIKLSYAPPGNIKIRYALDHEPTGTNITMCAGGNLIDRTTKTTIFHGREYPLFYACPHFELTAINI